MEDIQETHEFHENEDAEYFPDKFLDGYDDSFGMHLEFSRLI